MIDSISLLTPTQATTNVTANTATTSAQAQEKFADTLKEAINSVNDSQIASDEATNKLINGGDIELHEVMIASQKASITLNTTMQIRNKAVEAYQEIMRMSM